MIHHIQNSLISALLFLGVVQTSAQETDLNDKQWEERTGFIPEERREDVADTPADVDGLRLWLDAGAGVDVDDNGRVKAWRDQSGLNNHLANGGASWRPTYIENAVNGLPALHFDGDENHGYGIGRGELELGGKDNEATLFLVFRGNAKTFGAKVFCYGKGQGTGHILAGVEFDIDIDKRFSSDIGTAYKAGQGYRVFTARVDGSEGAVEVFENARRTATKNRRPFPVLDKGRILIGCRDIGKANNRLGARADVAEVLLYNVALEDDARAMVERYLMTKYGLTTADTLVTPLAKKLAYAYYPGDRRLEVAFDATSFYRKLDRGMPADPEAFAELRVRAFPVAALADPDSPTTNARGKPVFERVLKLSAQGLGQQVLDIPDLPDGEYRVQYATGDAVLWADRPLIREHFAFEDCDYGLEHKVYPPFEPVEVEGERVRVVDREYRLNALGGLDQVVSQGRALLDQPVRLMAETPEGPVAFEPVSIEGRAAHPDVAEFTTRATSDSLDLTAKVRIEEDGFMEVNLTYAPTLGRENVRIKRVWLEMGLPERSAPLCHLVGFDAMRYNYAGRVPQGGSIRWHQQPWRPPRWSAEPFADGEAPEENLLWDTHDQWHWGKKSFNFAPYIWLGAEERGLAWFGDSRQGYVHDGREPLQKLYRRRDDGRVILRVSIVQRPVTLDGPRTVKYGFQASPTKPMREDWRGYDVPGGGGMKVVVWGGYYCNDKYPDPKDWSLVDKIVAGRGSGEVDRAFFEKLDKQRRWPHMKVYGKEEWIDNVLHFANKQANQPHPNGVTVYFEEHVTHPIIPEFATFRDEWVDASFARYKSPPNWPKGNYWNAGGQPKSANSEAYRNFVVHYADQWMRRGVGIYYDNTYPKLDRNHHRIGRQAWRGGLWGHRAYYKRVWKRSRELMEKGMTPIDPLTAGTDNERRMPLHIVGHVTNCQVLPYTTWWDATLGIEQPYQKVGGQALPFPPDYLRAMTMGRSAGLISYARHALRNEDAFGGLGLGYGDSEKPKEEIMEHRRVSDWGMGRVHEIHRGPRWGTPAHTLHGRMNRFGYGKPGVTVHNYWDNEPVVQAPDSVKWLAMTRDGRTPFGMVLLQSYQFDPLTAPVEFADATALLDVATAELLTPDENGSFHVPLAKDYGTRLLLAARDAGTLAPLAIGEGVLTRETFAFGTTAPGWSTSGGALRLVEDTDVPDNTVLRVTPGHPSRNGLSGSVAADDFRLRLRFRLPADAADIAKGSHGILEVKHHWNGQNYPNAVEQKLTLSVRPGADEPRIAFSYGQLNGKARPNFENVAVNKLGEPRPAKPGAWRTLEILATGATREIFLDGELLFRGETDIDGGKRIGIGPGWQFERSNLPHVEVDDIEVTRDV